MVKFSDAFIGKIQAAKMRFPVRVTYHETLEFLYWACLASERLLSEASDECLARGDCGKLGLYYLNHLEEEKGELPFLVNDLKAAGREIQPLPDPIAIAMIGTQYYLLKHVHPVCLLGYMAVQEATPTPLEAVEVFEKYYGSEQVTFIRMHAEKDLIHREELIAMIEDCPEDQQSLIYLSIQNTLDYLGQHYAGVTDG
ncbi:MAG TPA: hypothetical protein VK673_21800 [Chthoniobacterales bacterium]|nr:hypothetical protein [Chthoniobacterales bacterium]